MTGMTSAPGRGMVRVMRPSPPCRRLLAVLWPVSLAAVAIVSLIPVPEPPPGMSRADLLVHVAIYAWLGLVLGLSRAQGKPLGRPWLWLAAYGLGLEVLQGLTPWRHFALDDAAANACGALIGLLCARWLSRRLGWSGTATG